MKYASFISNHLRHYAAVVIAGIATGFVSVHLFNGGAANTLLWGIASTLWGLLATTRRQSWKFGALYGFTLSYSFLWLDKSGNTSVTQFLALVAIIAAPSLFGALCGAALSRSAFWAKQRLKRP